ncbi:MAG: transcriptional repressor [Chloroflexota bacterium]|nr:transcriptional repressor [Chloroflexota bacterium]
MTQHIKKYEALFSQVGHRRTVQRQKILQVLEEAEGHLTIEQMAERIQSTVPCVNLSTIYRNVELLNEMGLVRTNHLPGKKTTYELADGNPHVHLLCQHCHSITHLDAKQLETLQADIQSTAQFHVVSLSLTVAGYCSACWALHLVETEAKAEE